jgi:hypothetical protein
VPELALDHVQGNSLTRQLDGVGVAELVRSEAATHAGIERDPPQPGACGGTRPRPAPGSPRRNSSGVRRAGLRRGRVGPGDKPSPRLLVLHHDGATGARFEMGESVIAG